MNEAIIERFNSRVQPDDEVYILGDVCLGDAEEATPLLRRLQGRIHVILGNHDTDTKIQVYKDLGWEVLTAARLKYKKKSFWLSHFPTIAYSPNDEHHRGIWEVTLCLYGHTHQKTNFYKDNPYIYHVGVDSHDCYPVSIDEICEEIKEAIAAYAN